MSVTHCGKLEECSGLWYTTHHGVFVRYFGSWLWNVQVRSGTLENVVCVVNFKCIELGNPTNVLLLENLVRRSLLWFKDEDCIVSKY